ncbi:MAG TPA: cation diffusion facilitator family transporter [Alphaproteobacteria bacterium]
MSHNHSHTCNHSHSHSHTHVPKDFGRTFLIAASLNMLFIVAEVIYGLKANSLALLADAGHNFSDVIGLLLAWGAWWLSKRKPSARYTYGLRSTSILAALANAILLLVAVGGIAWEAVERFTAHQPIAGGTVMAVAGLGIVINGATAWMFSHGQGDLNVRGAYLHLAADALVSVGVVLAGFIISRTGWLWLDPVTSLVIVAVIIVGTWGLLRDSVNLALHAVPAGVDIEKLRDYLTAQDCIGGVHDLHVWGMSTTEIAMSVHLVTPKGHPGDKFLEELTEGLQHQFGIHHTTIQIELGNGTMECRQQPDEVV